MLASTGKSSLIAFLTMVKPDTLTTDAAPAAGRNRGRTISSRAHRGASGPASRMRLVDGQRCAAIVRSSANVSRAV